MTEVGIETLRENLADYLKRVREGERVVITEDGRSIALLTSMEENETARRAWELVESGAARWQGGKPKGAHPRPQNRGKSASDMVLEDRR
jgi:prevent-host-death family protein